MVTRVGDISAPASPPRTLTLTTTSMEDIPCPVSPSHPYLPPELERIIFETAALARRRTIPRLMLVAGRVKLWIEPLLYEVIMLSGAAFEERDSLGLPHFNIDILLKAIKRKPPLFFQNAVQHLFLEHRILAKELDVICTACTGVVNLFHFNTGLHNLAALRNLHHLRRLTLSFPEFLLFWRSDGTHPVLNNLTHLELYAGPIHKLIDFPSLMSRLTHISLNFIPDDKPLQTALCESTHLQCIVFLSEEWADEQALTACGLLLADLRFVCVHLHTPFRVDWLYGAVLRDNYWTLADAFITARREGKIDRFRCIVSDLESDSK
ncbi:hypothetical protein MSAN_01607900 [Mycena sanguinolenta]|uniref:Uncharacterized protein n=1 Tax=Mycena sanguinolenta TaxID=230812 RepID=A0A8H7CXF6_9AGAR|nr:hypothetical protein MSAN_01607900 [Mycena sanguinolenta]